MTQNKPLSEEELREKVRNELDLCPKQNNCSLDEGRLDKVIKLILQDRKAHEERIKNIIKMSDKYTFADGTVFIRQRNQGEKTDENN